MPSKETITNTIPFQVYSFDAVFHAIQPYLKEGFKFDLESNEGYPNQIGFVSTFAIQEYRTEIIPDEPEVITAEPEEVEIPVIASLAQTVESDEQPKTRRGKARAE